MSEYARKIQEYHRSIADRAGKHGFVTTGSLATGRVVFQMGHKVWGFRDGKQAEAFLDGYEFALECVV